MTRDELISLALQAGAKSSSYSSHGQEVVRIVCADTDVTRLLESFATLMETRAENTTKKLNADLTQTRSDLQREHDLRLKREKELEEGKNLLRQSVYLLNVLNLHLGN